MRLWHIGLIPYLPRKQLISQWRECCCIAKNIKEKGSPNHLLVNKIMEYPEEDFNYYADAVASEMIKRGYRVYNWKFYQYRNDIQHLPVEKVFKSWHTKRYAKICMANLLEKYSCYGMSTTEWAELLAGYKKVFREEFVL